MARVKTGDKLGSRYFAAHKRSRQHRLQQSFHRWQIQKERHLSPSSDDWRKVLALLEDHTPSGEEHFKRRLQAVDLPNNIHLAFRDNAGAALSDIMMRTGSYVQTDARQVTGRGEETFSSIGLLGTPQQNREALKILPQYIDVVSSGGSRINQDFGDYAFRPPDKSYWDEQDTLSESDVEQLEKAIDQVTDPSNQNKTSELPIRTIWAKHLPRRPESLGSLFRRPDSLSPIDLDYYIENLTQPLPRLVIKKFYGAKRPESHLGHVDLVTNELVSLLTDEAAVKAVPASALDRALQYLTKHSKFDAFRKIFAFLEPNGYVFAVSNWNVLLAAAAKMGDVFNFRYVVRLMIGRKVPLSPMTWALFHDLMCRRFPLEGGIIVETMRRKGLLVDNHAASLVAANSAGGELRALLAMKGDLQSFYQLYDNRFALSYGRGDFEWLNINVVHRICGALLEAGRVEEAFAVLEDYRTRNRNKHRRYALDTSTLNIFLTFALRDLDASTAVGILERFRVSQPGAMGLNHVSYSILFSIAWRKGYYNMLRVIWRYACVAGHTSFTMQDKIRKSLFWHGPNYLPPDEALSRTQLWMAWAGDFAVGVQQGLGDLSGARYLALSPHGDGDATADFYESRLSTAEVDLVRHAVQPRMPKDSQQHRDHVKASSDAINGDFGQVQKLAPTLAFAELLKHAFKTDREWKAEGFGHARGLLKKDTARDMFAEMMHRGVRVPMRVGDYTQGWTKWEKPGILFGPRRNEKA